MPELPDVLLYLHALRERVVGQRVERVAVRSPFVVRSVDPPIDAMEGRTVRGLSRMGKRIVFELEGDLFLLIHLMIAGRFRWLDAADLKDGRQAPRGRIDLACLDFPSGRLLLTEAGTRKRASLHLVHGRDGLAAHDRAGLDVLGCDLAPFAAALRRENHTVKRALTDPRILSGIGNAYSDEILHRARLSPVVLTQRLSHAEMERLFRAAQTTLADWIERLREQFGDRFPGPGDVTAFRSEMAVHGKFGQGCPACGAPVQRIVYANRETNYCPGCQTGGRVLADRSLSRLLRDDWPRTLEELEQQPGGGA